ncbi:hypothetical protein [Okeania sp. KiyG1]|uniref:hypothetical protein n=1 Tax=Okeania sp. KiyG1 TaxID=2720165 RepID=UPI0019224E1E|nr:hypothetical protein [Okeania sp. KiyG1]
MESDRSCRLGGAAHTDYGTDAQIKCNWPLSCRRAIAHVGWVEVLTQILARMHRLSAISVLDRDIVWLFVGLRFCLTQPTI